MCAPQEHIHLNREMIGIYARGTTYLQLNFQEAFWSESSLNANHVADHLSAETALQIDGSGAYADKVGLEVTLRSSIRHE